MRRQQTHTRTPADDSFDMKKQVPDELKYNDINKFITHKDVNTILKKNGINEKITHLDFYQLAFIHKSYCKDDNTKDNVFVRQTKNIDGVEVMELQNRSYERLEYLGDTYLATVVATYLYKRFEQEEGFLTRMRTRLVNGDTVALFSRVLKLPQFVVISKHIEENCNGRNNKKILEDVFEAFIGAIIEDFGDPSEGGKGYEIACTLITNIIENNIDFAELVLNDTNFKDQLLRHCQHNYTGTRKPYPTYKEISVDGPTYNRIFTMAVYDPLGQQIGTGTGKCKKKAEQLASKDALINLGVISG